MSSARINNSDYCWRKRVVDNYIAEVKTKYLHLCNTNKSIAAMYEFAAFLEQGERHGFDPDCDAALKNLKKAAKWGHSLAYIDLSKSYGGEYWCSYPNVKQDFALSFEHLVSASLCSIWDGHKEGGGHLVGPQVFHYALFEALSSGH